MPTIAIVLGVRIIIYPKDHLPPHLHAKFAEHEAMISIVTGDVLQGSLPRAKLVAVQDWLASRREHVAYVAGSACAPLSRGHDRLMKYRIKSVEVVRYPVLRVTFDDGLSGEYDLSESIAHGPMFERLKDPEFFAKVAVGEHGYTFGWNLDDVGDEIDFCTDATRIRLETQMVDQLAEQYRLSRTAAE